MFCKPSLNPIIIHTTRLNNQTLQENVIFTQLIEGVQQFLIQVTAEVEVGEGQRLQVESGQYGIPIYAHVSNPTQFL